jgi:CheY-like chemotaxis protein
MSEQIDNNSADKAGLILVIDDDADNRLYFSRFLEADGYAVATAADGVEGLRLAHELKPTAITLDVSMPGIDGWTVLAGLKADAELAGIPVIMVSGNDKRGMGYALGAADHLTKPIDRARLLEILGRYRERANSSSFALVVDDEPDMREMLSRMIERAGWQVMRAENGAAALDLVARQQPALILLDLMMPEMDGFTFVRELRRRPEWQMIPVVVVTAMDLSDIQRRQLGESVDSLVQKSAFTREGLLVEISRMLHGMSDY